MNPYAERFVRSIKEECLNRLIPIGESHLRIAIRQFAEHYHVERPHQGLGNELITPDADNGTGAIECHERLGLLKSYYRRAA